MKNLFEMPINKNALTAYKAGEFTLRTTIAMLLIRTLLFIGFQACFFVLFTVLRKNNPWMAAAAYWPFVMVFTNIVCVVLLSKLLKREGSRFRDFFVFERETLWKDLFLAIGLFLVVGGIGFLPSPLLGNLFFGDAMIGNRLFFQPLPQWTAIAILLTFPISMPFGELTTYFGYVMPRLELATKNKALAIILPAMMLSFQHAALPLLFNLGGMFLLWRALVFLPFAFSLAFIIRWKPRLFPFFLIGHFLIDIGTAMMFFVPMG